MVMVSFKLEDAINDRLAEFLWKKYRAKGKRKGETISQAITEYLDHHEKEVK